MSKKTSRHYNKNTNNISKDEFNDLSKRIDSMSKSWESSWLKGIEKNFIAQGGTKVTEPARQSYVVNKCITIIGDNAPQAPLTFFKGGTALPDGHPLVQLFRQPSVDMSEYELISAIAVFYALYGEAFLVLVESVGQRQGTRNLPSSLLVADPRYMEPLLDEKDKHLVGWTFRRKVVFDLEEVVHIKNTNPYKQLRGLATIEAVMTEVKTDVKAGEYQMKFFENSAVPGIVLTLDKADRSTPTELKKILRMWEQRHKASEKAYKSGILGGGMDVKTVGLTQTEMAFIDSRKFTRDTILSTFGVPPSMAGFTADINRAAAEVQRKIFWQDTIKPFLLRLQAKIQTKLVNPYDSGVKVFFDFTKVQELQREFSDDVDAASKLYQMSFSRNELNDRFNFGFDDDSEVGDNKYVPLNLIDATMGGRQFDNGTGSDDKSVKEGAVTKDEGETGSQKATGRDIRIRAIFERIQGQHEKIFHSKMKTFFFTQRKKVLALMFGEKAEHAIEAAEMVALIDVFDSEKKRMGEIFVGPMSECMLDGQKMALEVIGVDRDLIVNKDMIYSHLEQLKGVNDTVRKQLSKEIYQGMGNGETLDQIGERVRKTYNMATTRSRLIAQTETCKAISHASMFEYKASGVRYKRWVTAGDSRVRPEHEGNAAQGEIPIDSNFSSGESYPGAPGCRCSISPVVK